MADINKLFEKAEKYLQKQKFESALEVYQEIFRYEPEDDEVLTNLGDLSLKLNRTSEGLRYQAQLTDLYIKKNDVNRAIATCRKILKLSSQDVSALTKLAGLLEKTKKNSEALEAYREALGLHRKAGAGPQMLECLQRIVALDPANLESQVEMAEQAVKARQTKIATEALLRAAGLARQAGQEDRWAEFVERAHELDSEDEAASIAAAELFLTRGRAAETVSLLEPISEMRPDDLPVLEVLARGYLETGQHEKAEPICWKIYQARPETIGLVLKIVEGHLQRGKSDQALAIAQQLKSRLFQQGKRTEFLGILEKIYAADEGNLPVLEMLTNLYNELNKEEGLRRSLSRLFNLYVAAEQYDKAGDTLERIIDVDPYGGGHYDRLLTLEGHIDKIWYSNIASRVEPPSSGRGGSVESATGAAPEMVESLDDLIIEGEMYFQYQLASKLRETVEKINRLFPGMEENEPRLRELYNSAGFVPVGGTAPRQAPSAAPVAPAAAPARPMMPQESLDDLRRISDITSRIYREATSQGVLQVAVNEVGRTLDASRCWGALGTADRAPSLTVEYCSPATPSADVEAALSLYSALMQQARTKPDGWLIHDVSQFHVLTPVMDDVRKLGIQSLLALPLMEAEGPTGLLLVQQCERRRDWTPAESILLSAIVTQITVAVKNTKLRRLVRSLAGTDEETGLLPRSSYVDCLLSESSRSLESSRPLSVVLVEPENPTKLVKTLGDARLQRYLQQVAKAMQSHLRQNDIAVRYSPVSIAVILPDTALPQGGLALEKLRRVLGQVKLDGTSSPNFCCAVCDVPLGPRFDAVDGVTEVINRLETALDQSRKEGGKKVLLSRFEE
jgi:tetratricopeptide (TPR) repeat protein/GGDEF domain-containing protein